jgi:hypothetical protein
VRHCVHCADGYKGQSQFTYRLLSGITGIETNMLLIFFLSLITNLALFCDGCDVGTRNVSNFEWNKVCISVMSGFLKKELLKLLLAFIFHLWFH